MLLSEGVQEFLLTLALVVVVLLTQTAGSWLAAGGKQLNAFVVVGRSLRVALALFQNVLNGDKAVGSHFSVTGTVGASARGERARTVKGAIIVFLVGLLLGKGRSIDGVGGIENVVRRFDASIRELGESHGTASSRVGWLVLLDGSCSSSVGRR